ncbi:sugar phosphate isomerase/epimerase family protein [Mycolicibacterium sp.]|uniref:sugar phosphate isomerase/epimerase family protein n=1 Tax=Mycolicibacterium sp. TaxID=2320850 RepID=UPI0037C5D335
MRAEPIEVTIARLAKCGYDAIEISGEPEKYDTKYIGKLLKDHGLVCWGSVTLMMGDRNLLAKDEKARAMSVKYVKDTITMVKELGGQEITIVPCTVGKLVAEAGAEEEWNWAVQSLKACYEHGMKEGVRLAIEPLNRFETYFISRHDQALALAEAVGPTCGICLDAFHMNIEEKDMFQAIRNSAHRLNDFHVADNNRMACGMGALDWKKIIGTLKEVGYDGALTVEFVAPLDRTPANPYPNMLETGDVELTPEERKFMIDHGTGDLSDEFYTWLVDETVKTLRKNM